MNYVHQCCLCGKCIETTSATPPPASACEYGQGSRQQWLHKGQTHEWGQARKLKAGQRLIVNPRARE